MPAESVNPQKLGSPCDPGVGVRPTRGKSYRAGEPLENQIGTTVSVRVWRSPATFSARIIEHSAIIQDSGSHDHCLPLSVKLTGTLLTFTDNARTFTAYELSVGADAPEQCIQRQNRSSSFLLPWTCPSGDQQAFYPYPNGTGAVSGRGSRSTAAFYHTPMKIGVFSQRPRT
jgi:hypothetical protein